MSLKACLALSCFVSEEPGLTPLTLLAELTKPSHSYFFTSYIYYIRPESILHLALSILSILDLPYQS